MNLQKLESPQPAPDKLNNAIQNLEGANERMTPTEFNLRGLRRRRASAKETMKEKLAIGTAVVAAATGVAALAIETGIKSDATQARIGQTAQQTTPPIEQDREHLQGIISAPSSPPQTHTIETSGR